LGVGEKSAEAIADFIDPSVEHAVVQVSANSAPSSAFRKRHDRTRLGGACGRT
jgi:hypothetical protein